MCHSYFEMVASSHTCKRYWTGWPLWRCSQPWATHLDLYRDIPWYTMIYMIYIYTYSRYIMVYVYHNHPSSISICDLRSSWQRTPRRYQAHDVSSRSAGRPVPFGESGSGQRNRLFGTVGPGPSVPWRCTVALWLFHQSQGDSDHPFLIFTHPPETSRNHGLVGECRWT